MGARALRRDARLCGATRLPISTQVRTRPAVRSRRGRLQAAAASLFEFNSANVPLNQLLLLLSLETSFT